MPALPDFEALAQLRKCLTSIRLSHAPTLSHYISDDRRGFYHQQRSRQSASRSSSATCVSSLVNAGLWTEAFPLWANTHEVAAKLLAKPWKSAGLKPNNPFSVSFIIEGVLDLKIACPGYVGSESHYKLIKTQVAPILVNELQAGAISINPYPASAYLTQLAFRVVDRLEMATPEIAPKVHIWSRNEINKQIALISAQSRMADPLQLAYALILAATTNPDEQTSPEDKQIYDHALSLFFHTQNDDGTWPYSRPLFHYPDVGNAYCFDYELLTQLLSCKSLQADLLPYIPKLARAAQVLERTSFDLDKDRPGTVLAWASGHHPQIAGPESWSTASVYHFAYALDRLVAEAIRRSVFEELGAVYKVPLPSQTPPGDDDPNFAKDFLDADLTLLEGTTLSLRNTIARFFVIPIARQTQIWS